MRKREQFFLIFFFFLFLSIVIFLVGKTEWFLDVRGVFENATKPIQRTIFSLTQFPNIFSDLEKDRLKEEIIVLQKKIIDQKSVEKEVQALKDQFQTAYPASEAVLPARILGMPRFIPGVSAPSMIILDNGQKNGIRMGQAVVYQGNVVGKITKVSKNLSVVTLITDPSLSFAAKTAGGVLGVVKGQGEEIVFDNVLAAEELRVDEAVVTKGDTDENSVGFPPNLIVGKITSVDKTQSNLFQTAKLQTLLDFSKLEMVFIVTGYEK